MTEGKIIKALADSGGKLYNVPSFAMILEVGANQVKKHFPLNGADRVVTGNRGNRFTVVLIKGGRTSETAFVDTIWSLHAYQNHVYADAKERNTIYVDLLAKRPPPVIQTPNRIRERFLNTDDRHIIKEQASAKSFFSEKKTDISQEKEVVISHTFGKLSANKVIKEESRKNLKSEVKPDQKPNMKNDQAAHIKKETDTPNEKMKPNMKEKTVGVKLSEPPVKLSEEETDLAKQKSEDELVDVKMSKGRLKENTILKGKSGSSLKNRRPLENLKKSGPDVTHENEDIDDEIIAFKIKKRKRHVAIESDSEDDETLFLKRTLKTQEEQKQSLAKTGDTKNFKDKTPRLWFKDVTKLSKRNGIDDIDGKNDKDKNGSKTFEESQSENRRSDNKKRRRVLKEVTHTFKDEDGYLQTKITKEVVSETDSEFEESSKDTVTNKSELIVKPMLAPKGQTSLFAFFKKN